MPIRSSRRAPRSMAVRASSSFSAGFAWRAWASRTMACSACSRSSCATGISFAETSCPWVLHGSSQKRPSLLKPDLVLPRVSCAAISSDLQPQLLRHRHQLCRNFLPLGAPRIEPEKAVAVEAGLGSAKGFLRGHQFLLGLVHLAAGIAVKELPVGVLVVGNGTLTRLPGRHRAKQHTVPILVKQALAIVVPDGVDGARRPQPLPVSKEALNVPESRSGSGKNLTPVGVAGSHPGFNPGLGKGLDHLVEAGGAPIIPGHGDHVLGQTRS